MHRVLPGMQAAFVSIGLDRDAFLYVEDAAAPVGRLRVRRRPRRPIRRSVRPRTGRGSTISCEEGQEIVVQVTKDPIGGKGPRVTTGGLARRAHARVPARSREVGVSRRIADEAERERLRGILEGFDAGGGFIARTAALGRTAEELAPDRRYLTELAARIARRRDSSGPPALLHRELDLALRSVRDLASDDFAAIRVDDAAAHARLAEFLGAVAPELVAAARALGGLEPLFEAAGVETEIENALRSRVSLPSGGSIVIHQTEALVAIDVNTGRFVGKKDLEDTVFATNLEAVPEVARQIRLRDLGGLIVVDFIDMEDPEHRRELFELFEAELARDRARTRMLPVSEFGLIEITRQRSRGNLERVLTQACPDCSGSGRIKTDATALLDLRRALLQPPVLFTAGETVRVRVRPAMAELIAGDPTLLADAEERLRIRLELLPDETVGAAGFAIVSG